MTLAMRSAGCGLHIRRRSGSQQFDAIVSGFVTRNNTAETARSSVGPACLMRRRTFLTTFSGGPDHGAAARDDQGSATARPRNHAPRRNDRADAPLPSSSASCSRQGRRMKADVVRRSLGVIQGRPVGPSARCP